VSLMFLTQQNQSVSGPYSCYFFSDAWCTGYTHRLDVGQTAVSSSPTSHEILTFGTFEAHLRTRELLRDGVRVRLPDQSFQVLAMLLEHPGELVTREEVRQKLWPSDTFVDFDHGLNNAVNRLRDALGDSADSPRFIETLPRRGYRFIAAANGTGPAKTDVGSAVRPLEVEPEQGAIYDVSVKPADAATGRDYRWLLWGSPLILLLLTLLIGFELRKNPVLPSTRLFVLPPEGATFNLIGDNGGSVILSADGAKVAFVAVDSKGKAGIWVRPLGSLTSEAVDGTEGATFPFWSPDGRSLGFFTDGKLKKISLAAGPAVTICDAPFGRGASWNSFGTIIFAPTSHSGIYRVSDSGGVPTPITTVDTSMHTTHRWPRFLPDGQHFIYLAASHFHDASHNGVYFGSLSGKENKFLVSTDTDATYDSGYLFFLRKDVLLAQAFDLERGQLQGEPRPTVEKVLYDPAIWKAVFDTSGSGVMAYQLGEKLNGTQLRWFDRSGRQLDVLGEPTLQLEPHLSRDGRKLATGVNKNGGYGYVNIWIYDIARGGPMQVTSSKFDNTTPVWSADGANIFFAGKRQHYSIYKVDSSGATPEQLIVDTGSDSWPLDVSPDGRFLLYGQGVNIGRIRSQLWVYPLGGNESPFRLLEGGNVEANGQFSPDGRWVAYSSNQSGRDEVYVIPFRRRPTSPSERKTSAVTEKWQISLSGGRQPRWRRDGKELFYVAPDNTLTAVPVTGMSSKFNMGTPRRLFQSNPLQESYYVYYDVSPDGSRFIINTAAQERTAPITLVENWLSDFKK
jgi:DNA-binding winged helix-turn-helix (wHTH) protein/Tol biopolymer transport system component